MDPLIILVGWYTDKGNGMKRRRDGRTDGWPRRVLKMHMLDSLPSSFTLSLFYPITLLHSLPLPSPIPPIPFSRANHFLSWFQLFLFSLDFHSVGILLSGRYAREFSHLRTSPSLRHRRDSLTDSKLHGFDFTFIFFTSLLLGASK